MAALDSTMVVGLGGDGALASVPLAAGHRVQLAGRCGVSSELLQGL